MWHSTVPRQATAESQAAIERERTQFAVDQGKRLGDIKAALQADDLRKQGQFAAATIAQLRQEHAAKLEQMKRDEAEEIRQNPEYADAIRKKFAASISENAIHGSDAEDTAAFEIGYWFAGYELV